MKPQPMDENIPVRCVECKTIYTTSRSSFSLGKNKCPACGCWKAASQEPRGQAEEADDDD